MYRTVIIFLLLAGVSANLFSQRNQVKIYGTVMIGNEVSMKATEVSIEEWMNFIVNNNFDSSLFPDDKHISDNARILFNDLKKGNDFEYLKIVKNKTTMRKNFGDIGVRVSKNFKTITERDTNYFSITIPVTGITFKQALQFCTWKETLINSFEKIPLKVSLPSMEVYKKVIINKDSLNIKKCSLFNSLKCNCLTEPHRKDNRSQGKCLLRVDSYWPTDLGLYNLQGNAAEMTNSYGVAMGGSFRQYAKESYSDKKQEYSGPEDWLGFRYIVTLR